MSIVHHDMYGDTYVCDFMYNDKKNYIEGKISFTRAEESLRDLCGRKK